MANWNNPTLTSTYTNFVTEVKDRDVEVALWFEGMSPTNLPTNAKRLNTSTGKFEKWNGTAWVDAASSFTFPAMVVDGNVGIGTSSPVSYGTGYTTLAVNGSVAGLLDLAAGGVSQFRLFGNTFENRLHGVTNAPITFFTNNTEKMRLDASGNLGLGVVPSGWSGVKAIDVGSSGAISGDGITWGWDVNVSNNAYRTGDTAWKYKASSIPAGRYEIRDQAHRWYQAASGTAGAAITFTQAMTLDASGNLGIGTSSPGVKLNLAMASGAGTPQIRLDQAADNPYIEFDRWTGTASDYNAARIYVSGGTNNLIFALATSGSSPGTHTFTERLRLDSSGNLGLGVVPSAWGSAYRAFQFPTGAIGELGYVRNAYYNGTSWIYNSTGAATLYQLLGAGNHAWFTAPSGTAGNAITFTQAMTLDANGNLNIGSTSSSTPLKVLRAGNVTGGGWRELAIFTDASGNNGVFFGFPDSTPANPVGIIGATSTSAANALAFWTWNGSAWDERLRIDSSGNLIANSSVTGYWRLPNGTTAQRPTGAAGMIRFNTSLAKYEGHNGTAWSSIGGGATGGGGDDIFYENGQTVTTNYTITTNKNAMSAGPITVASGITVTVPSGSTWVVV